MTLTDLISQNEKGIRCICQIPEERNVKLIEIAKELDTTKEHLLKTITLDFINNYDKRKEQGIKERAELFSKNEETKSTIIPEVR